MPQVRFEYVGRNRHQQERDDIYKVQFEPYVGTRRQRTVSVDVVTDLSPQGQPFLAALDPPFPLQAQWPQVRMWSLEDHAADKNRCDV